MRTRIIEDPPGYFCLIFDLMKIDFLTLRQNQFYNTFIIVHIQFRNASVRGLGFAGGSGGGGSPPLGNTLEMVLIQLENSIWITYYKDIVNVQEVDA